MRNMTWIFILVGVFILSPFHFCHGQSLALKSDLLSDGLLSPNLGAEVLVVPHWTLAVTAHYQPFGGGTRRWRHWLGEFEVRRWVCTPFSGFFMGFHALCGQFNVGDVHLPFGLYKGVRTFRYEGWAYGGGFSYGYHRVISPRWGVEAVFSLGTVLVHADRYRCGHCGVLTGSKINKIYLGPTKAALSLVYMLK